MAWDKLSPVKTVGMATSVPSSQASPALVNALFERVEEQAEVRTFTIIKNNDNDNNNGNNNSGRPSLRLDNIKIVFSTTGERGWRSGESTHFPPMWPGFDSWTRPHMWVEFVVGSLLYSKRFFSGYSGFPLSAKTNISKFQFDPECSGV